MSHKYVDTDNIKFVLYELFHLEQVLVEDRYVNYDRESIDMLLESVKTYADQELFPIFRELDQDPARYEDGKIIVHEAVGKLFEAGGELGLIGSFFDENRGGLQLPYMAYIASYFILDAANNHLPGYLDLTTGSAHLLAAFASEELRQRFLPQMLSGQWAGTMSD